MMQPPAPHAPTAGSTRPPGPIPAPHAPHPQPQGPNVGQRLPPQPQQHQQLQQQQQQSHLHQPQQSMIPPQQQQQPLLQQPLQQRQQQVPRPQVPIGSQQPQQQQQWSSASTTTPTPAINGLIHQTAALSLHPQQQQQPQVQQQPQMQQRQPQQQQQQPIQHSMPPHHSPTAPNALIPPQHLHQQQPQPQQPQQQLKPQTQTQPQFISQSSSISGSPAFAYASPQQQHAPVPQQQQQPQPQSQSQQPQQPIPNSSMPMPISANMQSQTTNIGQPGTARTNRAKRAYAPQYGNQSPQAPDPYAQQQPQPQQAQAQQPQQPQQQYLQQPGAPQYPQQQQQQPIAGQVYNNGYNSPATGQPPYGMQQPQQQPQQPAQQPQATYGANSAYMQSQQQQQPVQQPVQQAPKSYGGMVPQNPPRQMPPSTTPISGMPPNFGQQQSQQAQMPRPRIDPDQVPSPIQVMEMDQRQYSNTPFVTSSRSLPPLATSKFMAIDAGYCNPRFMRMTAYVFPTTDEIANNIGIPLGCLVQPFAEVGPGEEQVPVSDCGPKGPLRCARCAAYINSFFRFVDGGRKTICNICQHCNDVPDEYFMNLEMSGRRMDADQRPELSKGVYDIVATKEYCSKPPRPAAYIFAIDVTWGAQQSGMLYQVISTIKDILYNPDTPSIPQGAHIGIVTFDRSVHFYNLNKSLDQPQMMLVPDINEVFIPLDDGFAVDPIESRHVIEKLLDIIPQMFAGNRTAEPAVGAAVQAIQLALQQRGGRLSLFLTLLPNFGPGQLRPRDEVKLIGTDKERQLYEPQDVFWRRLGQDLCVAGVSVDTYFFPNSYIDVATVGIISALTSGNVYYYPGFDARKHGERLYCDLVNEMMKPYVFDCLLRVRVSNGIHVMDHYGNFYMRNATDVEIAGMTCDKSLAVSLKHETKLNNRQDVYVQVAILYTSHIGQRRIRLINIAVGCTSDIPEIFRNADHESTIAYLSKSAAAETVTHSLEQIRHRVSVSCVKILSAYRKYGVSNSSPGQLILPETYKVLPVFVLALLKNRAFRAPQSNVMTSNNVNGGSINSDSRVHSIRFLKGISVLKLLTHLYPRLICLAGPGGILEQQQQRQIALQQQQQQPDQPPIGEFVPQLIRCSTMRLNPESIYALYNGVTLFISLGPQVSKQTLQVTFGTETPEGVYSLLLDPARQWVNIFDLRSQQGSAIAESIMDLTMQTRTPIKILRLGVAEASSSGAGAPGIPGNTVAELIAVEMEFRGNLVEDAGYGQPSYVDFLCDIHRAIQSSLID